MSMTYLSKEKALTLTETQHAAHCMIYAKRSSAESRKQHCSKVADNLVLMILREDGRFGFPGGYIDDGETWEQGMQRELEEEIAFQHAITDEAHYRSSTLVRDKVLHSYCLQISEVEFLTLERNANAAVHFGTEVMGVVRVPLSTLSNGRGFPHFLEQQFAGNSKEQLLACLAAEDIKADNSE